MSDALGRLQGMRRTTGGGRRKLDEALRASRALADEGDEEGDDGEAQTSSSDEGWLAADDEEEGEEGLARAGAEGSESRGASDDDDAGPVACVCGAQRDEGEEGLFWVQCSNPLCSVWQHGRCVGVASAQDVPSAWFCDACRGLSTALGHVRPTAPFGAHLLGTTAVGTPAAPPTEVERTAWRRSHDAIACAAVLTAALAADAAPQLLALVECSRPGALLRALGGAKAAQQQPLACRAASAGASRCTLAALRLPAEPPAAPCFRGIPIGRPLDVLHAALRAAAPRAAAAVLRELPGLGGACLQPDAGADSGTALHAAAAGGCLECLRLVLAAAPAQAAAALSATTSSGLTALMEAARARGEGSAPVAASLLQLEPASSRTAYALKRDAMGWTAAHFAAEAGAEAVLVLLAEAAPEIVHAPDFEGVFPLHVAAATGNGRLVRVLLASGASPICRDHKARPPPKP